jgi:RNA polymerase sigma-70 factor (ECF subfamily)
VTLTTEALWFDFSSQIYRFIQTRVRDPSEADDILQEVFVKVHTHIQSLADEERVAVWLYRIARNTIIDHYRKNRVLLPLPEDLPEEDGHQQGDDEPDVTEELAQGLVEVIEALPPKYRQALLLTEIQGIKQSELASRLGLSLSGAKSRVQRGRELLKNELLACCHFEFDRRGNILSYVPQPECCPCCPV